MRGERVVLRDTRQRVRAAQRLHDEPRRLRGERLRELHVRPVGRDGQFLLQHDRAGVHADVGLHDRRARDRLAPHERPLDGRRAPQTRQQARVRIQEAQTRHVQHARREDLAVRARHGDVRATRAQRLLELGVAAQLLGLRERQAQLARAGRDGRRRELQAAPDGLVGLRHDERHVEVRADRLEDGQRERGRPEERHAARRHFMPSSRLRYARASRCIRARSARYSSITRGGRRSRKSFPSRWSFSCWKTRAR